MRHLMWSLWARQYLMTKANDNNYQKLFDQKTCGKNNFQQINLHKKAILVE